MELLEDVGGEFETVGAIPRRIIFIKTLPFHAVLYRGGARLAAAGRRIS